MSKKVSRRRFLTYMLGGTAGFLGMGMLFPMVRFAIDPAVKKGEGGQFIDVGLRLNEITQTPKLVQFKVKRKDGWYIPQEGELVSAYVLKDSKGKIIALSPICKHLGCTVSWNSNPQFKNEFFCPCHFGRYDKEGNNIPGTPPVKPLDQFQVKEENGRLLIGPLVKS